MTQEDPHHPLSGGVVINPRPTNPTGRGFRRTEQPAQGPSSAVPPRCRTPRSLMPYSGEDDEG
jgi:hypothetical protein